MLIQIAIKENVNPQFLEYIGYTQWNKKRIYQFNIVDESHPKYKGTVGLIVLVKGEDENISQNHYVYDCLHP